MWFWSLRARLSAGSRSGHKPERRRATMTIRPTRILLTAAFVIGCAPSAFAQHEEHGAMSPDQIGSASVKFQTSCAAVVKNDFSKGVALLHSFWFPEAIKTFDSILARDPNCAMAQWGIALSHWGN